MNSGRVPGHSRGLLWPAALGYGAFEPDSAGVPGTATGRGAGTVSAMPWLEWGPLSDIWRSFVQGGPSALRAGLPGTPSRTCFLSLFPL